MLKIRAGKRIHLNRKELFYFMIQKVLKIRDFNIVLKLFVLSFYSPLGKKRDIMNIPIAWPSICPVSIEKEVEMLATDNNFKDFDNINKTNKSVGSGTGMT